MLGWAALVAGCSAPSYDQADEQYYQNDPDAIEAAYRDAIEDTGKNALLGVEKLLSAAMLRHEWENAESLAIRASTLVNIFLAGQKGEADALSLLGQEKDKPFKGEPHERAMVDFYLGLLRFRNRDYEGALAAFRSAMYKDRGSFLLPVQTEEASSESTNVACHLYADDYALLKFFAAKCAQLLDEPGEALKYAEEAKGIRPELSELFERGMDPRNNVLVVVEAGRAPFKVKTGPRGAVLGFARGPQTDVTGVYLDGEGLFFGLCEDLYYQATTLGGRAVDELNLVKAQRQEALKAAGFAATMAGSMLAMAGSGSSHSSELQTAGLIAMAVGIGAMIFADVAIDPSADVRAWTMLPGEIYLAVGQGRGGARCQLSVAATGDGVDDESQEWTDVPLNDGVNLLPVRLLAGRRGGPWEPPPRLRPVLPTAVP